MNGLETLTMEGSLLYKGGICRGTADGEHFHLCEAGLVRNVCLGVQIASLQAHPKPWKTLLTLSLSLAV